MRITGTTAQCEDCPFNSYYSGGMRECSKTHAMLPPKGQQSGFPEWCPLPEHPAIAYQSLKLRTEGVVAAAESIASVEKLHDAWTAINDALPRLRDEPLHSSANIIRQSVDTLIHVRGRFP